MITRFRAGDAAVPIVVVQPKSIDGPAAIRCGRGVAAWAERSSTTISVDVQFDRMPSRTSASRPSIVRVYRRRTSATRLANQHWFRSGSHSAASLPPFCERFTAGLASVRFSRSEANRRFVAASAESPILSRSDLVSRSIAEPATYVRARAGGLGGRSPQRLSDVDVAVGDEAAAIAGKRACSKKGSTPPLERPSGLVEITSTGYIMFPHFTSLHTLFLPSPRLAGGSILGSRYQHVSTLTTTPQTLKGNVSYRPLPIPRAHPLDPPA